MYSWLVWVVVLQALHYLRKLCSHPLLVLDRAVPQHAAAALAEAKAAPEAWDLPCSPLRQLHHAPKLLALRQLLQVLASLLSFDSLPTFHWCGMTLYCPSSSHDVAILQ